MNLPSVTFVTLDGLIVTFVTIVIVVATIVIVVTVKLIFFAPRVYAQYGTWASVKCGLVGCRCRVGAGQGCGILRSVFSRKGPSPSVARPDEPGSRPGCSLTIQCLMPPSGASDWRGGALLRKPSDASVWLGPRGPNPVLVSLTMEGTRSLD